MSTQWRTVQVFVSSTFRDMQAERDHLARFVFPRLREELLKKRIHFVDVDLRWGVTSEQDVVGVCREIIDESRPRFICMLGGRYGWVPPGQGTSITADEVQHGVLQRMGEHGYAFFYFRDPETTAAMNEICPGEYREPPQCDNARKLALLKRAIEDAGFDAFIYAGQWNQEQKRLIALEQLGERVFDDLLGSVKNDPEFADRFREVGFATDEFSEEDAAMEAFVEQRIAGFVVGSRGGLFERLITFAQEEGSPNIFVLTGQAGSGKSALLAGAYASCRSAGGAVIGHFVGASAGSADLRRSLRRLCSALAEAAGSGDSIKENVTELIEQFRALIHAAAARQRVVLFLDALNQMDSTDSAHLLHWLPRDLPPNVRVIASSLEHPTLEGLRARGEQAWIETVAGLAPSDVQAMIAAFMDRYHKRMSAEQIHALLAKEDSRLPLYVVTALEELRTLGTYEEITSRIRDLPGDTRSLFVWILRERLSADPGFRDGMGRPIGAELVGKFGASLGTSRHGLSAAELAALLDPGDPLGNVAAMLRLLRPFLMRRGELLDFFHGQFREAAEAEFLDSPAQRLAAHRELAIYFRKAADPRGDGSYAGASIHALSELPFHQVRAEAWPDLVATLESVFFLEAKVTRGMAFDLPADYATALRHLPSNHPRHRIARLLEEALRRDLHFIARHADDYPQSLFQCLWNSCWWFDCPQASRHYRSGSQPEVPPQPWNGPLANQLASLLESWRSAKASGHAPFVWLRSLRPPVVPLGCGQSGVLVGPDEKVNCLTWSPDGQRIVSGGKDGLRFWDAATGQEIAAAAADPEYGYNLRGEIMEHKWEPQTVCFSTDGQRVLAHGSMGISRAYEANTARPIDISHVAPSGAATGALNDVTQWSCHQSSRNRLRASAPDGRHSADVAGKLLHIHREEGSARAVVATCAHPNIVETVAFSPDGRRIATGCADRKVYAWDAASGKLLAALDGHSWWIRSVSFSPDGRRLISTGDDTARIWDVESHRQVAVLRGHTDRVNCAAFSPDGRYIATASDDKTIRIWNAEQVRVMPEFDAGPSVSAVAFAPDGLRFASGANDGSIRIWSADTAEVVAVLTGHKSAVQKLLFSPDCSQLLSWSINKTLRSWDVADRWSSKVLGEVQGSWKYQPEVFRMRYSMDGRRILIDRDCRRLKEGALGAFGMDLPGEAYEYLGEDCFEYVVEREVLDASTGATLQKLPADATPAGDVFADESAYRGGLVGKSTRVTLPDGSTLGFFPGTVDSLTSPPMGGKLAGGISDYVVVLSVEVEGAALDEAGSLKSLK
jgi:WD40 repeat protein